MPVTQPVSERAFSVAQRTSETGSRSDSFEIRSLLNCMSRAGRYGRSAAHLGHPLTGLGVERQKRSTLGDLNLPAAIRRVVLVGIQPHALRESQPTGIAQKQDCLVAQSTQIEEWDGRHGDDIQREDSVFLNGCGVAMDSSSTVAICRLLRSSVMPRFAKD